MELWDAVEFADRNFNIRLSKHRADRNLTLIAMIMEKLGTKQSSLPTHTLLTEWGHLWNSKKGINFLCEGLEIVDFLPCPSFTELTKVCDLIKKLSKVDTVKGSSVEKTSAKWKVTFAHIGN